VLGATPRGFESRSLRQLQSKWLISANFMICLASGASWWYKLGVQMGQLMPQPFKHPKTGVYWYRKTVPERLRSTVGKREIKFSLGTKDPREAKLRYPEAAARADQILQQATQGKVRLTHQQVLALAAEWYRRELEAKGADPGDAELLSIQSGILIDLYDDNLEGAYREAEEWIGEAATATPPRQKYKDLGFLQEVRPEVDALLAREGLVGDQDSLERLSEQVFFNKIRLLNALRRRALGDYREDGLLTRLPKWDRREAQKKPMATTTLTSLFEAWAAERQPPERTLYEWQRIIGRLAEHLGHEDAERVTKKDGLEGRPGGVRQEGEDRQEPHRHHPRALQLGARQ
jgi:hypothetical protein